uniref:Protein TOO MANY MOUTHS-like n=1 Tax=Rhizophora mucronata TaxID=61149 RepID=A0A2P2MEX4_RHIMU
METDADKLFQPRFNVLSDVRVHTKGRMLLLNLLSNRSNTIKFFKDLKSGIHRVFNSYSPKCIYKFTNIIV